MFIVSEDIADTTEEQKGHSIETVNITPKWSANIFRAERNESIIRISFNTTDNNADYQIYINNLGKDKPDYPWSVREPVLSGTMPNAGYHTLSLLRPIELYAGDYYSVIVKITTQYDYPTPAEGMLEGFFTASVNEGESYFASGDVVPSVWVDGKSAGGSGYNATVRVVTVARRSDEVAPEIITASLPVGSIGVRYEYQLEARGSRVIEWRSGRLPEGFALSREGVFSWQSGGPIDKEVKFTAFNEINIMLGPELEHL